MSNTEVKAIIDRLDNLGAKMDAHIQKSDSVHDETKQVLERLEPFLVNAETATRVGGWVGKILNTKLGAAILLALIAWFSKQTFFN